MALLDSASKLSSLFASDYLSVQEGSYNGVKFHIVNKNDIWSQIKATVASTKDLIGHGTTDASSFDDNSSYLTGMPNNSTLQEMNIIGTKKMNIQRSVYGDLNIIDERGADPVTLTFRGMFHGKGYTMAFNNFFAKALATPLSAVALSIPKKSYRKLSHPILGEFSDVVCYEIKGILSSSSLKVIVFECSFKLNLASYNVTRTPEKSKINLLNLFNDIVALITKISTLISEAIALVGSMIKDIIDIALHPLAEFSGIINNIAISLPHFGTTDINGVAGLVKANTLIKTATKAVFKKVSTIPNSLIMAYPDSTVLNASITQNDNIDVTSYEINQLQQLINTFPDYTYKVTDTQMGIKDQIQELIHQLNNKINLYNSSFINYSVPYTMGLSELLDICPYNIKDPRQFIIDNRLYNLATIPSGKQVKIGM